jgi:hypothetical protein
VVVGLRSRVAVCERKQRVVAGQPADCLRKRLVVTFVRRDLLVDILVESDFPPHVYTIVYKRVEFLLMGGVSVLKSESADNDIS